jgi:hypothetical protein
MESSEHQTANGYAGGCRSKGAELNKKILLLAAFLVMTFSGCGPFPTTPAGTSANSQSTYPAATLPPGNSSGNPISPINTLDSSEITPPAPEANPFVSLAETDLASRLQINPGQIHFLKMSDIDWQDMTKGCSSSPGPLANKGRIAGYSIWLETNGKNYLYHIGTDHTIFLCPE